MHPFQRFRIEPLTDEEAAYVRACVKRSGKRLMAMECFHNAQRTLTMGDTEERLTYAEGRARGVHHGWLVIAGKVVDLTFGPARVGLKLSVRKETKADPRFRMGIATGVDLNERMDDDYIGTTFPRATVFAFVLAGTLGQMLEHFDALTREAEGAALEPAAEAKP